MVHSDPLKFSKAVVELMQNPKKWVAQTIAAREYLQAHLQPKVQRQILSRILPRFANSPGASTMLHQQLLLRSANIYPLTPKDHSSTVYDDTLNIHLQQRRILSLNKNDFDSDRSDNDDVQDGEMGSFINPGIAWLHGSIYLITARYHSGKWVDERRHRKVCWVCCMKKIDAVLCIEIRREPLILSLICNGALIILVFCFFHFACMTIYVLY